MRIALVYNEPLPSRYQAQGEELAVASVMDSVRAIEGVLTAAGHTVTLLGLQPPIFRVKAALARLEVDLIFNLFEGFDGRPETEWQVAGEVQCLGCPCTGALARTLALCLNKARTKQLLSARGIPTPPFQLLYSDNLGEFSQDFPVIVKPLQEDASHGLTAQSVVHDPGALARQVCYVEEKYGTPTLVERFLPGREFSVSVLGNQSPRLLPVSELAYSENMPGPRIISYVAKWLPQDPAYQAITLICPAQVPEELAREIKDLALAAHRAVGAPPYARVDLRSDDQGRLFVLEVNPNPDLGPEAGMALQAQAAGLDYSNLILTIVDLAAGGGDGSTVRLRRMVPDDLPELVHITEDTGFFRPEEVVVAREVLTEAASGGEGSGYQVYVAADPSAEGRRLGYVCFGPTPLTRGTWDLYWIAVAPQHQGLGIGRRLMGRAEEEVQLNGGRQIVVETSSQELYEPTRRFYCSLGYQEVSRIPDFYDRGDAKVTFAKALSQGGDHGMPP
jgi:D-alanine-D-alanine ligase